MYEYVNIVKKYQCTINVNSKKRNAVKITSQLMSKQLIEKIIIIYFSVFRFLRAIAVSVVPYRQCKMSVVRSGSPTQCLTRTIWNS